MDAASFVCRTPGCGGPVSGVCINGLKFDECPDVIPKMAEGSAVAATEASPTSTSSVVMVRTGGAASLQAADCDALLRGPGATLVGIVAGPEVGKTTMIATLYELVHRARLPNFRFAGSESLRGYEERCFLSRTTSNGAFPDTPRTKLLDKLSFTHLRLKTSEGMRNIIFSDRSGEHFENALNKPNDIATFEELNRADVILLLVDLLQFKEGPHLVKSITRRLFMAMQQQSLLTGKPVRLVGTKADLLTGSDLTAMINSLDEFSKELANRDHSAKDVQPRVISSRARSGSSIVGEGLEPLLADLLTRQSTPRDAPIPIWPVRPTQMDLLMQQYLGRST